MDNKPKPHYRCFACLRLLGFGYDRTAKHFKTKKESVYRWFKLHRIKPSRPPRKPKPKTPYPYVDFNQRWQSKSQKYLRTYFRTKLWYFWKHNMRPSTVNLIGCSKPEFIHHISSLFQSGMTTENYTIAWEFDHIVPLVNFDLRDPEQRKKAFHFSNIQPLTPHDNAVKFTKTVPTLSGLTYEQGGKSERGHAPDSDLTP